MKKLFEHLSMSFWALGAARVRITHEVIRVPHGYGNSGIKIDVCIWHESYQWQRVYEAFHINKQRTDLDNIEQKHIEDMIQFIDGV